MLSTIVLMFVNNVHLNQSLLQTTRHFALVRLSKAVVNVAYCGSDQCCESTSVSEVNILFKEVNVTH